MIRAAKTNPGGFTLIETMVAAVATALIMGAVLSVVALVGRDRARLLAGTFRGDRDPFAASATSVFPARSNATTRKVDTLNALADASRAALVDLLRRDLVNARLYRADPDGKWLALRGFGSMDRSLVFDGRAADVSYRIVSDEQGCHRLVREQRLLNPGSAAQRWAETVRVGVAQLNVLPLASDEASAEHPSAIRWRPLSQRLRLQLIQDPIKASDPIEIVVFR